jgi:flagellar FliL protein
MAQPAATNQEIEEGAPVKGGNKGLIISLVLLLVLTVGGFAAYELLGGKAEAKKNDVAAKHEQLPARYVTLEPPFVVNFEAESTVRFLQITIGVMTRDEKIEHLIRDNDPRIRNDLLLILGNQNYQTVSKLEGKEELRKRCLESVRAVVAESGGEGPSVEALYFTSFVMQ